MLFCPTVTSLISTAFSFQSLFSNSWSQCPVRKCSEVSAVTDLLPCVQGNLIKEIFSIMPSPRSTDRTRLFHAFLHVCHLLTCKPSVAERNSSDPCVLGQSLAKCPDLLSFLSLRHSPSFLFRENTEVVL